VDESECYRWDGDNLLLSVRVQPRSSRTEVLGVANSKLRVKTTAPPADGKANKAVIALLAKEFGVSGSRIELLRGHTSRDKLLKITGPVSLPRYLLS
jgi:uncharacterized protein (TIGR00251 family)